MDWFTCELEKHPPDTKSKYVGMMGQWLKDKDYSDSNRVWNFFFKQKMIPVIFDYKDPINNGILYQQHLEDKKKSSNPLIDKQQVKDYLIKDYGCQFIHFRIYDYTNYFYQPFRGDYCRLVLISTDDNDWEVSFKSRWISDVKNFISKNYKKLTLQLIENFIRDNDYKSTDTKDNQGQ